MATQKVLAQNLLALGQFFKIRTKLAGIMSTVSPALAAERGLRQVALHNVTLYLAFRHRYAQPYYGGTVQEQKLNVNFAVHKFSPIFREAYPFLLFRLLAGSPPPANIFGGGLGGGD